MVMFLFVKPSLFTSHTFDFYLLYLQTLKVAKFKALYDLAKNDPEPNYNLSVL